MAIPTTAVVWPETMDPSDLLDFSINCAALLETNESITSYTVLPGPESVLLGLSVANAVLTDNVLYLWLSVDSAKALDPLFSNAGTSLPIEVTLNTSMGRRWQRTVVVKVAQK